MNEKAFKALVEAGWNVVESGFEPSAFLEWRRNAHSCLTSMLGEDHSHTRHFAEYSWQTGKGLAEEAVDRISQSEGFSQPITESTSL